MTKGNQNPALQAVKKHRDLIGKEIELSTGVKAILTPVGSDTVLEAQALISDPPIPIQKLEDGRELENPNDPDYVEARRQTRLERAMAAIDVMIVMGVELVGGVPDDDKWLGKLRYLERRKRISLEGYDLTDDLDREFLYKKHIAMSSNDWILLNEMSGIDAADIEAAETLF